jgi:hypothetical protein
MKQTYLIVVYVDEFYAPRKSPPEAEVLMSLFLRHQAKRPHFSKQKAIPARLDWPIPDPSIGVRPGSHRVRRKHCSTGVD